MDWIVKPKFNAALNAAYFPTGSLNAFQAADYNDKFGFYQQTFGVYSYMKLNKKLKYVVHYPVGSPFMWQPHRSCAWTPTGSLSFGKFEVEPCPAKINEEMCYDEHFNGAFEGFLTWGGNPAIEVDEAGKAATNAMIEAIVKNATMGARLTMTVGQLYDPKAVTMAESTNTNIEGLFKKTIGTCRGWIELAITKASEDTRLSHLNVEGLITPDNISADGKTYTGAVTDALKLYDNNMDAAPDELAYAAIEGGVGGFADMFYMLWIVSPSILRAVSKKYNAQKTTVLQNEMRISKVPYTLQTERGARTIEVFKIDNTIVIPLSEVGLVDAKLSGTSHFCYLTVSGCVNLGGSFADIPVPGQSEVAMMIQQGQDVDDLGRYKFLSHALFATAINDTQYLCGSYEYAEPNL